MMLLFFFIFNRLILIAEKTTVYDKFPTPLINRLEKHFVLTKSILTKWQHTILEKFEDWIDQFCNVEDLNRYMHFIGRNYMS